MEVKIPRPGEITEFDIHWEHPMSLEDKRDQETWVGVVQDYMQELTGRPLRVQLLPNADSVNA